MIAECGIWRSGIIADDWDNAEDLQNFARCHKLPWPPLFPSFLSKLPFQLPLEDFIFFPQRIQTKTIRELKERGLKFHEIIEEAVLWGMNGIKLEWKMLFGDLTLKGKDAGGVSKIFTETIKNPETDMKVFLSSPVNKISLMKVYSTISILLTDRFRCQPLQGLTKMWRAAPSKVIFLPQVAHTQDFWNKSLWRPGHLPSLGQFWKTTVAP